MHIFKKNIKINSCMYICLHKYKHIYRYTDIFYVNTRLVWIIWQYSTASAKIGLDLQKYWLFYQTKCKKTSHSYPIAPKSKL